MHIEIELELEWAPSRNTEVTQSQLCIDEIEVIMETFSSIRLKESLPSFPLILGFVAGTSFHCREDMHQARMGSPFFHDILNAVFLAKGLYFSNILYLQSVLFGNAFCILSDFLFQRLGKGRIIKDQ